LCASLQRRRRAALTSQWATARGRDLRRLARVVSVTAVIALGCSAWGASDVSALACVERPDDETAAREAINGEHPDWASGYIVAVVEGVQSDGGLLAVTVRPTHVFAGTYAERMTLRARSDGPPDPEMYRVGRSYFLSLGRVGPPSDELLVQPCAPNFAVTAEQLDRLVDAAPRVEIREPGSLAEGPPISVWSLLFGGGIVVLIGLGLAIVVRRGSSA
jgi:hypothetical protein